MKKLLVTLGGLVLAAGCTPAMMHTDGASNVPATKHVTQPAKPAANQQTVDVDYKITDQCRADLAARPGGPAILSRYDTWFGYWETEGNPPDEVANTAAGFKYEAARAGATTCG